MDGNTHPRVVVRVAAGGERCGCGSVLAKGDSVYAVPGVPDLIGPLLAPRSFCSIVCARAFLLETLEFFEAGAIRSMVSDADAVASTLRGIYLSTAEWGTRPAGPRLPGRLGNR